LIDNFSILDTNTTVFTALMLAASAYFERSTALLSESRHVSFSFFPAFFSLCLRVGPLIEVVPSVPNLFSCHVSPEFCRKAKRSILMKMVSVSRWGNLLLKFPPLCRCWSESSFYSPFERFPHLTIRDFSRLHPPHLAEWTCRREFLASISSSVFWCVLREGGRVFWFHVFFGI